MSAHDKKNGSGQYEYEFYGDTIPTLRNYRKELFDNTISVTSTGGGKQQFNWHGVNNLAGVVITAHVNKDYAQEEKEFYGNKFITEKVMEKRNYQSFKDMIYHFSPFMKLVSQKKAIGVDEDEAESGDVGEGGPLTWHLYPTRTSTLKGKSEVKIYSQKEMV